MKRKFIIGFLILLITVFSYLLLFSRSNYRITYRTENKGQIQLSPDKEIYSSGEEIKVKADPVQGWKFARWEGDLTGNENPVEVSVKKDMDFKAVFNPQLTELEINTAPEQKGQVKIDGQITERSEYNYGTNLELNPQPEPGWDFVSWKGPAAENITEKEDSYRLIMNSDKKITAIFEKKEYDISYDYEGQGMIHIKPQKDTYYYRDIIEVKAEPDKGWKFEEWGRDLSGTSDYISFILVNDVNITGHFKPKKFDLSVNILPEDSGKIIFDNKTMSDNQQFEYNTELDLNAKSKTGWEFSHWKDSSGNKINDRKNYNFIMKNNKDITAVFKRKEFTLTYEKYGQGDIILEPQKDIYQYGDKVNITARPAGDWGFDTWEKDLSGSETTKEMIIKEDTLIRAHFKEPEYELKPVLQKGDKSSSVEKLQNKLINKNFLAEKYIELGNYCLQTKLAVKLYQKFHNLEVDGIAGPQTWTTLFTETEEKNTYTVEAGDNLWDLASKWDTTPSEIREVNNLGNPKMIRVNQKLKIPGNYKIEPEETQLISWPKVNRKFPVGKTLTITDVKTGLNLRVVRLYGTYHADVEPLTAEDTAALREIYGGEWSWERRAVIVHLNDQQIAGSINGEPHGGQKIKNNNFDGHICLHFLNSKLHLNETNDPEHQAQVKKAADKNWPLNQ